MKYIEIGLFIVFFAKTWTAKKGHRFHGRHDFLINTPGCYIPNYMKTNYLANTKKLTWIYPGEKCGQRWIHIHPKLDDGTIKFHIDYKALNESNCENATCSFTYKKKFGPRLYADRFFRDGDVGTIEHDAWVWVTCRTNKSICYSDWYAILKKIHGIQKNESTQSNPETWNILIIGLDTMSRGRVHISMPKVLRYLEEEEWLDFRGHNKVALNTRPNMKALLTGRPLESDEQFQIENSNLTIISEFKKSGYITAYSEDSYRPTIHHTDTIHHNFKTLKTKGCIGKKSVSSQTLDYASQFVKAYKTERFFGLFWLVTASHSKPPDLMADPALLQDSLLSFFVYLKAEEVLNNTFVFFIGDHGVVYGRVTYSSEKMFYESRLPMFYMRVPENFRKRYPEYYSNLRKNQHRLTSHYDTYATFAQILKLSDNNAEIIRPIDCPKCRSLFEDISTKRSCADANIQEEWCTCHNMTKTENDVTAYQSILVALSSINKILFLENMVHTTRQCEQLHVKKVLRSHFYEHDNKTYYVSVVSLKPGNMAFESIVEKSSETFKPFKIISISSLADQEGCGKLAFCVCKPKFKFKQKPIPEIRRLLFSHLNKNKTCKNCQALR